MITMTNPGFLLFQVFLGGRGESRCACVGYPAKKGETDAFLLRNDVMEIWGLERELEE